MFRTEKDQLKDSLQKLFEQSKDRESFIMTTEGIKRKMEKGLVYRSVSLQEFDKIRFQMTETINESILDPIQKERFSLVFDKNDKMNKEVKDWILQKIEEWKKGIEIEFEMKDLRLYGSATGYQYTETADIDLHVTTTLSEEQIKETGKLIKLGNIFDNDKNPVTLFLLAKGETEDLKKYENLYDVETGKWIKKSDKNEYEVPYGYILQLSEFFMNAFDLSISQYERAKHEYKTYFDLDPEKQEITEEEKKRAVDKALLDLRASYDRLRMGRQVMMSFAKEGYEEGKDFQIQVMYNSAKDPRLSVNNAVYKMLERFNYTQRLKAAIKEAEEVIPGNNDSMDNRGVK
jgi:hypothetical protein